MPENKTTDWPPPVSEETMKRHAAYLRWLEEKHGPSRVAEMYKRLLPPQRNAFCPCGRRDPHYHERDGAVIAGRWAWEGPTADV